MPLQSNWLSREGKEFEVRKGPNYYSSKKKAPSLSTMYKVFAVDLVHCANKVDNIGQYVEWERLLRNSTASTEFKSDVGEVPRYMVVNWIFPGFSPKLLSTNSDGESFSMVLYAELNEDIFDKKNSSSLNLWKRFLKNSMDMKDVELSKRMKAIIRGTNLKDVNFNQFVQYLLDTTNGKPFLLRSSQSFFKRSLNERSSYWEIQIDMHRFAILTRKALWGMKDTISLCEAEMGLTVEAREEEEMPERILVCVKLLKVSYTEAVHFEP
jgi:hypothetical protein